MTVTRTGAQYKTAASKTSGWFRSGQEADIALSAIDFNKSGGPLLFNHNGGIATEGTRLILADRTNNRILIWNTLPNGNQPPDLVLGQPDFDSNDPGQGLNQLNWPIAVATDGIHLVVADTYNNRVLIWKTFPTQNAQPADFALSTFTGPGGAGSRISWPWAVWTNGAKLVVTSTWSKEVFIWNTFPTGADKAPDVTLANDGFGTPRSIASDGTHLVIGDHNGFKDGATFFWKTFPTRDNQPYDFAIRDPLAIGAPNPQVHPEYLFGPTITADGKLLGLLNGAFVVWNSFPTGDDDAPDLIVRVSRGRDAFFGGRSTGDGSGVAATGNRLYLSLANGNRIVAYQSMPTSENQKPDFAIGSPDVDTNTLATHYFITNPILATDGTGLFAVSDFDGKMYVWKNLPDESGAYPDLVYSLNGGMLDSEIHGGALVLAGHRKVAIWDKLPYNGEQPTRVFTDRIGNVTFQDLRGVALDSAYFYLSDAQAKKIYVWRGLPGQNDNPIFTLSAENPGRISSDGKYLVVGVHPTGSPSPNVELFTVDGLSANSQPRRIGSFNQPQYAFVADGRLFVAETGASRVRIWKNIADALAGKEADTILGNTDLSRPAPGGKGMEPPGVKPSIGRNKLFLPIGMAWDGNYLWVGENKFSYRILRFSPHP